MPELPEVQTIVSELAGRLVGRTITRVELRRGDIVTPSGVDFPKMILHRRIAAVTRRGKRIVFALDNGHGFYIHLGMTGRLTLESAQAPPAPHTHLILSIESRSTGYQPVSPRSGEKNSRKNPPSADHGPAARATNEGSIQLHFRDPRRFGGIFWLGKESADDGLGPEPLTLTARQLAAQLAKTARPVKSALLDQRLIAGLGNIYADEALHAAAIHPLTAANALSQQQVVRLNRAVKSTLRRAIHHRGSTLRDYRTATGQTGDFQKIHRVYARNGQPCLACGTPIERIVLSGRSTCFCPKCQTALQR